MGYFVRAYLINLSGNDCVLIISDSHMPKVLGMRVHFKEMGFLL